LAGGKNDRQLRFAAPAVLLRSVCGKHFPILKSKDLASWQYVGGALHILWKAKYKTVVLLVVFSE
jgi:hypothetical protein